VFPDQCLDVRVTQSTSLRHQANRWATRDQQTQIVWDLTSAGSCSDSWWHCVWPERRNHPWTLNPTSLQNFRWGVRKHGWKKRLRRNRETYSSDDDGWVSTKKVERWLKRKNTLCSMGGDGCLGDTNIIVQLTKKNKETNNTSPNVHFTCTSRSLTTVIVFSIDPTSPFSVSFTKVWAVLLSSLNFSSIWVVSSEMTWKVIFIHEFVAGLLHDLFQHRFPHFEHRVKSKY